MGEDGLKVVEIILILSESAVQEKENSQGSIARGIGGSEEMHGEACDMQSLCIHTASRCRAL